MPRILTTSIFALALACSTTSSSPASSPAGAQLAPWDQAKVTELANQLAEAANELYGTFYKQGPPQVGSGQGEDYRQLKQEVQDIQDESKQLAGALGKGKGREDTRNDYREKDSEWGKVNLIVRKGKDGAMEVERRAIPPMPEELTAIIKEMG